MWVGTVNCFLPQYAMAVTGSSQLHILDIKGLLAFLCPLNFLSLMGCIVSRDLIIEGASDLGIPLHEMSVVVCEPKKAS